MGRDDVLGRSKAGTCLQHLGDHLDPARVEAVLGLLEPHQRRGFVGAGQRQQPEQPERPLGQHPGRNGDPALLEMQIDLAKVAHPRLDAVHAGHYCVQRLFDGLELPGLARLQGVEEGRELLPHQPDVAHLLDGIGGAHALARLEIEEQPQLSSSRRAAARWG